EPGRRHTFDRRNHRELPRRRIFERQRDARRSDLYHFDPERHADLFRRQLKEPSSGPRRLQVEDRDDVAGTHPSERARFAAYANVDERRSIALELESRRKLLKLQGYAKTAFDTLLTRHCKPQDDGEEHRPDLQTHVAKWPDAFHVGWTCRGRATACKTSERNRDRSASAETPRSI